MSDAAAAAEEPFEKIETEDVMEARVVRHHDDVVIVLDNPRRGRVDKYAQNVFNDDPDDTVPAFAVTSKGFQFYAVMEVAEDQNNPAGEPIFYGSQETDKHRRPHYRITVKL